ncbi:MAG: NAD-binding protein [Alphaproteobacteria bacterium]|nr:NAD-binding protein [Alphaproteobacteria bacterium]
MYVVVVGMGTSGAPRRPHLDQRGHSVVAIDSNPDVVGDIEDAHDVATLVGYGASPEILRRAGCERADLMVVVTGQRPRSTRRRPGRRRAWGTRAPSPGCRAKSTCESGPGHPLRPAGHRRRPTPHPVVAHEIARIAALAAP